MSKRVIQICGIYFIGFLSFFVAIHLQNQAGFKPFFNTISNKTFLDSFHTDSVMVFFAYAGCTESCPPALMNLSSVTHQLSKNNNSDLTVVVVNLIPEMGAKIFHAYVKGYNQLLIPYTPAQKELNDLKAQFSVRTSAFLKDTNQPDHTSLFYLVVKKEKSWEIAEIYPHRRFINL